MNRLFNRLFSQIESLQECEDPLDPLTYRNAYSPLQLAVHHLAICRNLLETHLRNHPSQAKLVRPRRAKDMQRIALPDNRLRRP